MLLDMNKSLLNLNVGVIFDGIFVILDHAMLPYLIFGLALAICMVTK